MQSNELLTLGLGLSTPWKVISSRLDTDSEPGILRIEIAADRGSLYPCPVCGNLCKAHDYKEHTWQHLNFFQHRCFISAQVPRVHCKEHGVHQAEVPWARPGSGFTLLFEQALLVLCREMPVIRVAEMTGVVDHRIWRVLQAYVEEALGDLDLSNVFGVGVDETASKRRHKYVTIFVDMDREKRPVIFATQGKGRETFARFKEFLLAHDGSHENIIEVVCDMSPAFLSAAEAEFPYAAITVDWFHVVQLFTRAVDEVRKIESRHVRLPDGARWAVLKGKETMKNDEQKTALKELAKAGLETSTAFLIKEKLRWLKGADTKKQIRWRTKCFLRLAYQKIQGCKYMAPMKKALETFERHRDEIINRWDSMLTNARLEGLNSLFQAVRARARGYRNPATFITMIYLIGAPIQALLKI